MCTSTTVISTPGNGHCTLAFRLYTPSSIFVILNALIYNFWHMAANRQTYTHTHARAQCNHASVGLAQARPKYLFKSQLNITALIWNTKQSGTH